MVRETPGNGATGGDSKSADGQLITWLHLSDLHLAEGQGYAENIVSEPY